MPELHPYRDAGATDAEEGQSTGGKRPWGVVVVVAIVAVLVLVLVLDHTGVLKIGAILRGFGLHGHGG